MDQFIQHWINREATAPWLDQLMADVTNFSAWKPFLLVALLMGIIFGKFRLRAMLLCLVITLGITDGLVVNSIKHAVGRLRPFQAQEGVRVVHLKQGSPQFLSMFSSPEVKISKNLSSQSTDAANCGVASVLAPSSINDTLSRCAPKAPGTSLASATLKTGSKSPHAGGPVQGRSFPSSHSANIMLSATVIFLFYRHWGMLAYLIAGIVFYSRIYTGMHWPTDVLAGAVVGFLSAVTIVALLNKIWQRWGKKIFPAVAATHPSLR